MTMEDWLWRVPAYPFVPHLITAVLEGGVMQTQADAVSRALQAGHRSWAVD